MPIGFTRRGKKPALKLYVVKMTRDGERSGHSYIEGVYHLRKLAVDAAKNEALGRAGKYEYEILEFRLNESRHRLVR